MVIVLDGADFSAKNLGQIKLERKVSEEVKTLLSKYARDFSEEEQLAVQDFFDVLDENGIKDKVSNLYLPILATSLSDAMYNVQTGVVDTSLNSVYAIKQGAGLFVQYGGNCTKKGIPATISTLDMHAVFSLSNDADNVSWADSFLASTRERAFIAIDTSKCYKTLQGNSIGKQMIPLSRGVYGYTCGQSEYSYINEKTSILVESAVNSTEKIFESDIFDLMCFGSVNEHAVRSDTGAHIGVISLGYHLSQAQLQAYSDAINALTDVFNPHE